MRFQGKAAYAGPFDGAGIPLLDYRGDIGRQYNPIAIAQYGLARFNRWCSTADDADRAAWLAVAQWLTQELKPNAHGVPVWFHHFDWPYRQLLKAPWYSGLAQGNGLSLLVRAAQATGDPAFAAGAHRAFQSFQRSVSEGGVLVEDDRGHVWIEEYLVDPPSHILNGFIWALWGVYDYARWTGRAEAENLWRACLRTLEARLGDFDTGWWSLYESPAGAAGCWPAATTTRCTSRSCASCIASAASTHLPLRADRFEGYLHNRALSVSRLSRGRPCSSCATTDISGHPAHPLLHALFPAGGERAGQPDARALPRVGGGGPRGARRDLHSQPSVRQRRFQGSAAAGTSTTRSTASTCTACGPTWRRTAACFAGR